MLSLSVVVLVKVGQWFSIVLSSLWPLEKIAHPTSIHLVPGLSLLVTVYYPCCAQSNHRPTIYPMLTLLLKSRYRFSY